MSIVPQNRLIFAASLVFVPAAVIAAAAPKYSGFGVFGCAAVIVLAGLDALLSRGRLDDIRIETPGVIRASVGRDADLRVRVTAAGDWPGRLKVGLALPTDAVAADLEMQVAMPADRKQHVVPWPLRARRRGRWPLRRGYLEVGSRYGLWGLRQQRPLTSEIRIYPNLTRERRQLAALFLNRGTGVHAQRQVGKGREFEQLRDYLPGDGIEDIHWKASARRGSPITKVYQIERTQRVYVALDTSRLSGRRLDDSQGEVAAPSATSILDRYTAATLALAMAAERQGDLFGLLCFDDRIRSFLPARSGKAHYGACRDAVYSLGTNLVSPDFNEVFTFIGRRLRRRSLLVFLTSLDDPVLAESFCDGVEMIGRRHIILVNMLKTHGIGPLFDGPAATGLDDVYARLGGHLLWRRIVEIEKVLNRRGIRFSLLDHAELCPELIGRYLSVKRRQVL